MAIKKCTCSHRYQDIKYGVGKRVANPLTNREGYRCTVCGKDITEVSLSRKKK